MSSKRKTRHLDEVELLKREIDKDPMIAAERCQDEFKDLRDTSRTTRSRLVLKSFFIAKAYIDDAVQWEAFIKNHFGPWRILR